LEVNGNKTGSDKKNWVNHRGGGWGEEKKWVVRAAEGPGGVIGAATKERGWTFLKGAKGWEKDCGGR